MLQDQLNNLSPWTILALMGCIALALVDEWRNTGATEFLLLLGTLPNLVSVPTLVFGFMHLIVS